MKLYVKNSIKIVTGVLILASFLVLLIFLLTFSNSFSFSGDFLKLLGKDRNIAVGELELSRDSDVVLVAVGDIMLSREVERRMIARGDWKYPFLETVEITSGADITFGNLETTILEGNLVADDSFFFRTDPQAVEGLKFAGFDVLSLANNHMMNFGSDGLESTVENLDGAGIDHIGAGMSDNDINRPVIIEAKGMRLGFLAYTYNRDKYKNADGGFYGLSYMDTENMKAQVGELEKEVDVVVVSMHAGTEYRTTSHISQENFARAAIDAGADLVIGHHPHVVETFEKYKDGYIIYSLGNFVFDQMWSEETRLGAMAKITFRNGEILDIEFVSIKIFDYAQPQILEGDEKEMILERLEMERSN